MSLPGFKTLEQFCDALWLNSIDTRDGQTEIPNLDQLLTISFHFGKSDCFLDILYLHFKMVPFKELHESFHVILLQM